MEGQVKKYPVFVSITCFNLCFNPDKPFRQIDRFFRKMQPV